MDYSSIYSSIDEMSIKKQNKYFWIVKAMIFCQILTTILDQYMTKENMAIYIFIGVNLLTVCFLLWYIFGSSYQTWILSRAVAESIKSISWKFAMQAKPFNVSNNLAEDEFKRKIDEILNNDKNLKKEMSALDSNADYISKQMKAYRMLSPYDRFSKYNDERIKNQRVWYEKKAKYNKRMQKIYVVILTVMLMIMMIFSIVHNTSLPIATVVAIIFDVLLWVQLKRYKELGELYTCSTFILTKYYKNQLQSLQTNLAENELIEYVDYMEDEFTREHYQWLLHKE